MLRAWQDVIEKWRLVPDGDEPDRPLEARLCLQRARTALLAGRLDEARQGFEQAAELGDDQLANVGLGDVHLARGRWLRAAEHYRLASAGDAAGNGTSSTLDLLVKLGGSQVLIGEGNAADAVRELEPLLAERPDDPVLRYYVASAWCSVAEQCRSRTDDDVLVITNVRQLRTCERAAQRILELDVDDEELNRGARQLLAEVTAGRKWRWAPEGVAVSLAVLTVCLGLTMVVAGGVMGNVWMVVIGIVIGVVLLAGIVLRFRRQTWRRRADQFAGSITRPGM